MTHGCPECGSMGGADRCTCNYKDDSPKPKPKPKPKPEPDEVEQSRKMISAMVSGLLSDSEKDSMFVLTDEHGEVVKNYTKLKDGRVINDNPIPSTPLNDMKSLKKIAKEFGWDDTTNIVTFYSILLEDLVEENRDSQEREEDYKEENNRLSRTNNLLWSYFMLSLSYLLVILFKNI